MGRFCKTHARERTTRELEAKVEELNKLACARQITPGQYNMMVRCQNLIDERLDPLMNV